MINKTLILFVCECVGAVACRYMCHDAHVEVKEQLRKIDSFLSFLICSGRQTQIGGLM